MGYANGPTENPSYQDVCADSGHAETVRIVFEEAQLPLDALLEKYFMIIDPVSVNRQGHDVGIQYRTGIYYTNAAQRPVIDTFMAEETKKYDRPLAVEVAPLQNFFSAEEYHQKYLDKNPGGYCHVPASLLHLEDE